MSSRTGRRYVTTQCTLDVCNEQGPLTHACPHVYIYSHKQYAPIDLEWKVIYVGSATDASKDQTLDEILVGPVPVGINKFILQADPPDANQVDDLLGVTVVLVTCSYKEREFVRVGYYVNNELEGYNPEVDGPLTGPLDMSKIQRQILFDKPRVTKFPIPWTLADEQALAQKQAENDASSSVMGTPSTVMGHFTDEEMDDASS